MSELVKCPKCDTTYRVAAEQLGRTANCKNCSERFTLTPSAEGTRQSQALQETGRGSDAVAGRETSQKIGRFEIRGRLGAGAFGAVYRAYDPVLEREVALKVPHAGLLGSEQDEARFLREPKAAAQLRHPNIVPVYDAGFDGECFFIASAFVEGNTLQQAIEQRRPDFREMARTVMHLAEGLDYAHNQGIVHRDVKPANIMLDETGEPLLMDFGLARIQESADQLTLDGTIMGTPAYMPPEQAAGRLAEVGPASDQYSLGVVLYELLCGERPFNGPPELVISLVLHQDPASPRSLNATIPKDLETVCLKAMSKDTRGRYANCGELADDLRRWLDDLPIHARPLGPLERTTRWAKRNPLLAGMALALVVTLVFGTAISSLFGLEAGRRANEAVANEKRASANADRADKNAAAKEAALQEVQREKKLVEEQKRIADEHRDEARRQTELANKRLELAQHGSYNVQMALVRDMWWRDVDQALSSLQDELYCPVGFRDFTWRYFHRLSNREIRTIHAGQADSGHANHVELAIAPSGKLAAWIGGSGTALYGSEEGPQDIKLFRLPEWREIAFWNGRHRSDVRSLAISPDARLLATGSQDMRIILWNLPEGSEKARLEGHSTGVNGLVFSSDGRHLFSAAGSVFKGEMKRWDLQSLESENIEFSVDEPLFSLAMSPDGKTLAAGARGGVVVLDSGSLEEQATLPGGHDKTQVAYSPAGDLLGSCGNDGVVRLWDTETWQPRGALRGHTAPVLDLAFSSDGRTLASAGGDNSVRLWDVESQGQTEGLTILLQQVSALRFLPGEPILLTAHLDLDIRLWNADIRRYRSFATRTQISDLAFSPDGQRLVFGGSRYDSEQKRPVGVVTAVDLKSGEEGTLFPDVLGSVNAVALSPDGETLAACVSDVSVGANGVSNFRPSGAKIWDLNSGQESVEFKGKLEAATSVTFSPDGSVFAMESGEGVGVWQRRSGRRLANFEHSSHPAFGPDGTTLATLSGEYADEEQSQWQTTIKIWDLKTSTASTRFGTVEDSILCLLYSPDGSSVFVAANGRCEPKDQYWEAICWDVGTGKEKWRTRNKGLYVYDLAISPDGRTLVSVDGDFRSRATQLRFWDPVTGQTRGTLLRYPKTITSVTFSPDGTALAAAGESIMLWEAEASPREGN